jgi:AbrB family looped-hinge helix DNA binding protein
MPSAKVSTKHQISIPSAARRQLGIEPGDRLSVEVSGDALVLRRRPARPSERLRGLGRDAWQGVDPVEHVRQMRREADRRAAPSLTRRPAKRRTTKGR